MKKKTRRHPRAGKTDGSNQETMDGYYYSVSSTYLVQKFALNSFHRQVARKGMGRRPDPSFRRGLKRIQQPVVDRTVSGRKCSEIDLQTLGQHFGRYIEAVNLVLSEVYSSQAQASQIGEKLETSKGQGYVVLREESFLEWKKDNRFGQLVYERMFRNVLETAARIVLSDYTRRKLVNALLGILSSDWEQLRRLLSLKRIPADLIREVKDSGGKKKGSYYHYALTTCRQVRRTLDIHLLEISEMSSSFRSVQRKRVRDLMSSSTLLTTHNSAISQV